MAEPLALDVTREEVSHKLKAWLETQAGTANRPMHSARRPLPLSPLMDPVYQAAKKKHHLPKAPPSKEPTPFQRQLERCPYAQALATPVRMCHFLRTRLPSFFLQDFATITHPDTNEPWCLPRSLTSPRTASTPSQDTEAIPHGTSVGGKYWFLARSEMLRGTLTKKSGLTYHSYRLSTQKKRTIQSWPKDIRWRKDIDTFVLELMRRRIVEKLEYLCARKSGYVVKAQGWNDAKRKKQIGAFLWMGREDVDRADDTAELAVAAAAEPGEFATLDMGTERKSKLPVHNLQVLLGQEHVKTLRRKYPEVFNAEISVLKDKRTTIDVILRLWKLQGFLAKYEEIRGLFRLPATKIKNKQ